MSLRLTVIISLIMLVVLTASPWLWQLNPWWIAGIAPVLIGWYVYVVYLYLRWARRLSGRGHDRID